MNNDSKIETLLTANNVSKILKVSKRTVYRLYREGGGLSYHQIGRGVRFSKKDIETYIDGQKKESIKLNI